MDGVLGWPGRVPHVVKDALSYLFAQSECGLLCPVNMIDSTARMLRRFGSAALQEAYVPRLTTLEYERLWQRTQWMTEKTGGSDVGAHHRRPPRRDGTWRLWRDKWFCSNANTDKLGSRSMATGEVTFSGAVAYVVGDVASGFQM